MLIGSPRHCIGNNPLLCRELAAGLKSSMKISAPLIDPGTEFDAVRESQDYVTVVFAVRGPPGTAVAW